MSNERRTTPQTTAELRELIDSTRGKLESKIAGMSDEALSALSDGWSIQDHLAHVSAWERRIIGEVTGDREAERFGLSVDEFAAAETDGLNAMLFDRRRDVPTADVRLEFASSGKAIRSMIARLSDVDLGRPVRPDDPHVETLAELIGWDTFWHYPEHTDAIEKHLAEVERRLK